MARSATLNPASMPFFPGGVRANEDEMGRGLGLSFSQRDRNSSSSLSIDYLSVRSSPSPPEPEQPVERASSIRFQPSPSPELSRQSPTFRQLDPAKSYAAGDTRPARETSSFEGNLEGQDTPSHTPGASSASKGQAAGIQQQSFFSLQQGHETPPVNIINNSNSNNNNNNGSGYISGPFTSSSPSSSLDSSSNFARSDTTHGMSFEAQLGASPIIHDILDRLVRCEYSTREMQRDLGDIQRKVNLLVERSLGVTSQPEFKDPFAPNSNAHSFSSPALNGHRASIGGNIPPNQSAPSDDITTISQRLNTLTSSVGQLLAIQTHQIQSNHLAEIAPNQNMAVSNQAILGHGARPEVRASPRVPNPPMRTWSAGALEIPVRQPEGSISRQEALLREKRRSVSGLLRRDSTGVVDSQGDWPGGSPRDNGPMISKWEQLSLAPELLRSLGKFGVGPPNKIQQRALPFLLRGADIIAQAPPTQERIAAYVIPAIQIAVNSISTRPANRGPIVIMISTTVDQATQAQRMIRDLGGPIGVRSALGVGATSANSDLSQELRLLQQNMPHIICGTPQKLHALFTATGGLVGSEVRFLVLDEVDQLIARNLHEFVFNIVKLLPPPRSRPLPNASTPTSGGSSSAVQSPFSNPFDSSTNPQGRRFSGVSSSPSTSESSTNASSSIPSSTIERQTALFSNTVPQDVLNLASAIQLREPVRVLVRRDGNVTHADTNQGSRGLRQFYLYLAFTAGGRSDPMSAPPGGGLGIIGSGRGASSAESAQAREWKLDALVDLFDDVEITQAIVHVGGMNALDSVVYKLASRSLEAIPLHGDMNPSAKLAALNKFRGSALRQNVSRVLVVYDVQVKTPEVSHVPLILNYDLPKAVEEYAHRVAPAIASNYSRAGVVVNFVTATGGDVEMLRSIECFYKIKCPEVPMSLRDIV